MPPTALNDDVSDPPALDELRLSASTVGDSTAGQPVFVTFDPRRRRVVGGAGLLVAMCLLVYLAAIVVGVAGSIRLPRQPLSAPPPAIGKGRVAAAAPAFGQDRNVVADRSRAETASRHDGARDALSVAATFSGTNPSSSEQRGAREPVVQLTAAEATRPTTSSAAATRPGTTFPATDPPAQPAPPAPASRGTSAGGSGSTSTSTTASASGTASPSRGRSEAQRAAHPPRSAATRAGR